MLSPSVFRAYDVRGIIPQDFIPEDARAIARALYSYAQAHKIALNSIVIARDTRATSLPIYSFLTDELTELGIDVIDLGVVPTPLFYFALHTTPHKHGIMITASHNATPYNGFKICINGTNLHGSQIQELGTYARAEDVLIAHRLTAGTLSFYDILPSYLDFMMRNFSHLIESKQSMIFNCNNAVTSRVIPLLIKKFGWTNAHAVYTNTNEPFPAQAPDPTNKRNMELFLAHKTSLSNEAIGLCFDGDGDRMIAVDEHDNAVAGDVLLGLFAQHVLRQKPEAAIVYDIKASRSLNAFITSCGGKGYMTPTGHSNLKVGMLDHKAILGGELSCHFFFADRYFGFDDGIYAALRLIEIVTQEKTSLSKLTEQFPHSVSTRELRIPCPEAAKGKIIEHVKKEFSGQNSGKVITIDGVRIELAHGWGLIRPSNTESLVSVRFEADTRAHLSQIKEEFMGILSSVMDKGVLEKHFNE